MGDAAEIVIPKFPHESFNVLSLVVTGLFFFWAYHAIVRFHRTLFLRRADPFAIVHIRGIGSNLYYFDGAWPSHVHAILHTRQAEPPKLMKSLIMPFQFQNIQWMEPHLLKLQFSSLVDCIVIVLLDVNANSIRQCFGTEERSNNNNRNFLRTRTALQKHCLKYRKNSQHEVDSLELAQILASGDLCSIGSKGDYVPFGDSAEITISVQQNRSLHSQNIPRTTYSPMDVTGDIEVGVIEDETSTRLSSPRTLSQSSQLVALLIVPNHSKNQRFEDSSFVRTSANSHEDTIRNPALFLSSTRTRSISPESSKRSNSESRTAEMIHSDGDSMANLDFCFVLLSSANSTRESEALAEGESSSSLSGHSTGLRIEELFIHTEGGLHSVQDVYGVPSQQQNTSNANGEENEKSADQKSEESDCVICLTEKKDIFLLPCRHLCVCRGCFIHIDKCPVCRTPFNTYVLVQDSEGSSHSVSAAYSGAEEV